MCVWQPVQSEHLNILQKIGISDRLFAHAVLVAYRAYAMHQIQVKFQPNKPKITDTLPSNVLAELIVYFKTVVRLNGTGIAYTEMASLTGWLDSVAQTH